MNRQAHFVMLCPAIQQDGRTCRRKTVSDSFGQAFASPFCGIHSHNPFSEGDFKKAIELGQQEAFEQEKRRQECIDRIRSTKGIKETSGEVKTLVPLPG